MAIKFPNNPNEGRRDPFSDDAGRNPFADGPAPVADSENIYAAPLEASGPAFQPQYIATESHRGGTILFCGLVGMIGGIIGLFGLPIPGFGGACLMIVPWLSLTLSLPAGLMGHADLKAYRAGAMEPYGRSATRAGYIMGVLGAAITVLCTAYYVIAMIAYSFTA